MKIYTKTGDDCTTCLAGGTRVPKNHPRIEAYGAVDELMAHTAYLRDSMYGELDLSIYQTDLLNVLDHLMRIAAHLSADESSKKYMPAFTDEETSFLEARIDDMQAYLTPIDKFTLPGGHPLISLSHIARTVCRRTEREIVCLHEEHDVLSAILHYMNRLSDYFYVLGRRLAEEFSVKEILWEYEK